ncbi:MAG: YkgJ family cysteine cluster protein [Candidatus Nanoarchaeia archaeon]|nr:YkgJ family cysteine cluster protein [Candidatus Nanoarchaeia archaeon]
MKRYLIWLIIILVVATIIIATNFYIKKRDKKEQKLASEFEPPTMTKFPCYKCGNCCRIIKYVLMNKNDPHQPLELRKLMNEFPYKFRKDGCEKLVNNQCSVYEKRPDICSINRTWERYYKDQMTLQQYHDFNLKLCNQSQDFIDKYNKKTK